MRLSVVARRRPRRPAQEGMLRVHSGKAGAVPLQLSARNAAVKVGAIRIASLTRGVSQINTRFGRVALPSKEEAPKRRWRLAEKGKL